MGNYETCVIRESIASTHNINFMHFVIENMEKALTN
jgi:hypothetical protein